MMFFAAFIGAVSAASVAVAITFAKNLYFKNKVNQLEFVDHLGHEDDALAIWNLLVE